MVNEEEYTTFPEFKFYEGDTVTRVNGSWLGTMVISECHHGLSGNWYSFTTGGFWGEAGLKLVGPSNKPTEVAKSSVKLRIV
jgi:hypothetical protein